MAEFANKPTLLGLPPELFEFIYPHAHALDVPLADRLDSQEMADLRSLSLTCRWLRDVVQPLLWRKVEVVTVRQLAKLCEVLKARPSIATYIKSFRFLWNMDGDGDKEHLWLYVEEEGSALELAFRDRMQMWNSLMKAPRADVVYYDEVEERKAVLYQGDIARPPGRRPLWSAVRKRGPAAYDWLAGEGGRGPDGKGEDAMIKSGKQLVDCVTEVVNSLTSLETFGWETLVMPIPPAIFDALVRLPSLTDLRLVFSTLKCNLTQLPLWELSGKLKALSLRHDGGDSWFGLPYEKPFDNDEYGASVSNIEAHPLPVAEYMSSYREDVERCIEAVHISTARRCILAAAQGGRLKRLDPGQGLCQYQFKIRELLPYWMRIVDWGASSEQHPQQTSIAVSLRRYFAHAALQQECFGSRAKLGISTTRLLTVQDLQAVAMRDEDTQEVDTFNDRPLHSLFHSPCLPWLVEDAQLAQQVINEWNTIVQRGQAEEVICTCITCKWYLEDAEDAISVGVAVF